MVLNQNPRPRFRRGHASQIQPDVLAVAVHRMHRVALASGHRPGFQIDVPASEIQRIDSGAAGDIVILHID